MRLPLRPALSAFSVLAAAAASLALPDGARAQPALRAESSFRAVEVAECNGEPGYESVSVRYRVYERRTPLVLEERTTKRGCTDLTVHVSTRVTARPMADPARTAFAFEGPGEEAWIEDGVDGWDVMVLTEFACCAFNHLHTYHRLSDGAPVMRSHLPVVFLEVAGVTGVVGFLGADVREPPAELRADTTLLGIVQLVSNDGTMRRWAIAGPRLGIPAAMGITTRDAEGRWTLAGRAVRYSGPMEGAEFTGVRVEIIIGEEVVAIPVVGGVLAIDQAVLPADVTIRAM